MDYILLKARKHRLYIFLANVFRLSFPYLTSGIFIAITTLRWLSLARSGIPPLSPLTSTTFWGLGPGVLAASLAFLCYNFIFIKPYYTLTVHESQDIIALLIFLVVAVLISQLVGRLKKNQEASLEREAEANRLYELSIGLAGVNGWGAIAAIFTASKRPSAIKFIMEVSCTHKTLIG